MNLDNGLGDIRRTFTHRWTCRRMGECWSDDYRRGGALHPTVSTDQTNSGLRRIFTLRLLSVTSCKYIKNIFLVSNEASAYIHTVTYGFLSTGLVNVSNTHFLFKASL